MTKTLIARISNLEQYDAGEKVILWQDPAINRWLKVYDLLKKGDNAIFISTGKLLIGSIDQIKKHENIRCVNIKEINCKNDQFLQLHEIFPELVSRVKANFQPFLHPIEINIPKLIEDAEAGKFVSYYILSNKEKYNERHESFKPNDRIVLFGEGKRLGNVKLHTKSGLKDFHPSLKIQIRVLELNLDEILEKNRSIKRESTKSNNVKRIKDIISVMGGNGVFKFDTFFSYHDALFNKTVYGSKEVGNSTTKIILKKNQLVYKISMSGKAGEIENDAFNYFMENSMVVVHKNTKAKGISKLTQGEVFIEKMKVGDYFYLCRGNRFLVCLGQIASDVEDCTYKNMAEDGWMQRKFKIVAEAINKNSYKGEKKWWTPNDNSTIINIPREEIQQANNLIFNQFFDIEFDTDTTTKHRSGMNKIPLNQIFFGPPGTGKTYSAIPYALSIIDGFELKNSYTNEEWELLKRQFDALHEEGRIEFVTFHQSMSYEDFVEGIKPKMDQTSTEKGEKPGQLEYEISEGIFKRIAERAAADEKISQQHANYMIPKDVLSKLDNINFGKIRFENWVPGNEIYEYCMTNNCICIPYVMDWDFSKSNDEKQTEKILTDQEFGWHETVGIKTIKHWLNIDDIVFVTSIGKNTVKAVAQITGDYYYNPNSPISYSHFRNVKWLMTDVNIPVESIYSTQFSSYAASLLYKEKVRKDFFKAQDKHENLKYVLIIDEINRGNIAAIFGELITLLESSKRIGENEHLKIKLPYSKADFEVPSNFYIIGTMNTADRSVEALDTALRRRFCFTEMTPIYDLPGLKYEYAGVNAGDLLKTINNRIEKLLDKDHLIGHSYFIKKDEEEPDTKFLSAFYKNIIPLLQEYFFGDYGKIGLVLGEGFVTLEDRGSSDQIFAEFSADSGADYEDKPVYRIIDYRNENHGHKIKAKDKPDVTMTFEKAIRILMRNPIE